MVDSPTFISVNLLDSQHCYPNLFDNDGCLQLTFCIGFTELLKIRAAEAKTPFPTRYLDHKINNQQLL